MPAPGEGLASGLDAIMSLLEDEARMDDDDDDDDDDDGSITSESVDVFVFR